MTHLYVWHDAFISVKCRIYVCDMTCSHLWHDSCLRARVARSLEAFTGDMTHSCVWHMDHLYVWHDAFMSVPWRIYMCDMTHSHAWHDSSLGSRVTLSLRPLQVTWLISMCDMIRLYVWRDAFVRVTWHIYKCDVTYLYVWHDSSLSLQVALSHRPVGPTRHVTDSCVRHDSFVCGSVGVVCVYMYTYMYICIVGLGVIYIYI